MSLRELNIRSLQHYLYCPHRWGLMEIGRVWSENFFVTRANLMHERVHNPDTVHSNRNGRVYTAVPVYNDLEPYLLYGVTDCLELLSDQTGVEIQGEKGHFRIRIIEYKPTAPRAEEARTEDIMQVFAQKICVDYIFGSDSEGFLYYADTKKRVKLAFDENFEAYDKMLRSTLAEMRNALEQGKIPEIRKGQKCSGCSLKEICMPAQRVSSNIREEIEKISGGSI